MGSEWRNIAGVGHQPTCTQRERAATSSSTTANDRVRPFHDRMPVIVAPPDFATWLDAARSPAEVERLFAPAPAASLTATPLYGWVNDVWQEGPGACKRQRGLRFVSRGDSILNASPELARSSRESN